MNRTRSARTTARIVPTAAILLTTVLTTLASAGLASPPAAADDLVAADARATVAAATLTPAASTATRAIAGIPRGIVVTNTHGQPVILFSKGEPIRRQQRLGVASTTFAGLTAGRTYTVSVAGRVIGSVVAINRPGPARALAVRTVATPGSVALTWQHRATTTTGGPRISYDISATGAGATTLRATSTGRRSTTLAGLDPAVLYTFTVTPRNSAGRGQATSATMTRTLRQISGTSTPVVESVVTTPTPAAASQSAPPPAPAAPPAPTPAPAPSTKTIYVCPDGYTEKGSLCERRLPYTYSTLPYTFHEEVTGPAPLLDSYETTADGCPSGYSLENYNWIKYCRRYGPAPTRTVRDAPPTGYTDTGTAWSRKDPTPSGYTDDGTQWVKVVAKEARIVPA
jgi:hypothetical protein